MSRRKPRRRNNLFYYIKEGISSIFTHGFMSFASVVIIIACLVIMGSFLLVGMNVEQLMDEVEAHNEVLAFVGLGTPEEEARALEGRILATRNVESATFVTNREAWDRFWEDHPEPPTEGLDYTILRHRFEIVMEDIAEAQSTVFALYAVPGIVEVDWNPYVTDIIITVRNIVTVVFFVIIGVLLVVSIFIISNTIKLATFDRREEIAIMRMVGATNWFIRWPFIFQGFILGLAGAAIAFAIQWALYGVLVDQIINISGDMITVMSFVEVADFMILVFMGTGFLVGTLGSALTIRNYLKV